SRSLTQPFLLRQNRIFSPLGEKRGNQSTSSPLVICFTSEPSVFIVNRSWLPTRELDQTIVPLAFPPTSFIAAAASAGGASSAPLGGRSASGGSCRGDERSRREGQRHDRLVQLARRQPRPVHDEDRRLRGEADHQRGGGRLVPALFAERRENPVLPKQEGLGQRTRRKHQRQ